MPDKKILVGKIVAPQGLRGEVRVQTYTANPLDFQKLKIENAELKVVRAIPNSNVLICKIDGVYDRNGAEALRGTELFVARDALPALPAGEFYHADLIGMKIIFAPDIAEGGEAQRSGKSLKNNTPRPQSPVRRPPSGGARRVAAIHNFGAGDLLELDNGEMLSFAGAKVDLERREIAF